MTTIASLAREFKVLPSDVVAFLGLEYNDVDEDAELDEATEAEYREQWAAGVAFESNNEA